MELDLDSKETQDIINQIPVHRRPSKDNGDDKRTLEGMSNNVSLPILIAHTFLLFIPLCVDDIAIAEVVAQVENDLRPKETNTLSLGTFMVIFLGGIVTAKIVSTIF
jgi:hypothetical protein